MIDVFSPLDLERLGVLPAAFGDIEPFVGEGAAHAAEDAAIDEVADRRLHHAPGRGGGEKDGLLGAEEFLERGMDVAVEILEMLRCDVRSSAAKKRPSFSPRLRPDRE